MKWIFKIYNRIKNKIKQTLLFLGGSEYCPTFAVHVSNLIIFTMILAVGVFVQHMAGWLGIVVACLFVFLWSISKDLDKNELQNK
jgi:hypothetical protein